MKILMGLFLFYSHWAFAGEPMYQWSSLRAGEKAGDVRLEKRKLIQLDDGISNVKMDVSWVTIDSRKMKTIAIIGDTGCRLKDGKDKGGNYQDCNDPKKWPFQQLVTQVESEHPDLIVHLGDYHYRESCSHDPKCAEYSKATGYTWIPWELDFFAPAKDALKKTPWLFVRGNHEECKRAGQGWTHLIAKDAKDDCKNQEETEIIEGKNWVFINYDSTWISDFPDFSEHSQNSLVAELNAIAQKIPKGKTVYLFTHKPILGAVEIHKTLQPVNFNFRKAFEKSDLKSKVSVIFAGHVHSSQISLANDLPVQVMEGNSGTNLDTLRKPMDAESMKGLDILDWRQVSTGFGYVLVQLDKRQQITFKDLKGQTVYQCELKDKAQNCFPKK